MGRAALETMAGDAAVDVEAFYAQPGSMEVRAADGPLLVVQADGKGVPMVQPPSEARPVRLGKGQKRTKKKEAVVTSLYTIAPYVRTPREVVAALLQDRDRPRTRHPVRRRWAKNGGPPSTARRWPYPAWPRGRSSARGGTSRNGSR